MSEQRHLTIGLDLGSSGVKATLLDPNVGLLASASAPVDLYSDVAGFAEADPEQWWSQSVAVIHQLLKEPGVAAHEVVAIAVSGMVPAVVVCSKDGRPLRRAILQNDARATREIRELREALAGVDLLTRTGSVLSQQSVAPTLMWLSRHEPAVWEATALIMGSYDWLALRLGARAVVEQNWAHESGLYDLELHVIDDVIRASRLRWPAAAEVARPAERIGGLSAEAAAATSLRVDTAIVVGGADHVLSAFGAGLVAPGDMLIKLGGAGDILAVADDVFIDSRLYLDAHPVPGTWLPNGCMATTGSLLRWEQSLLGGVTLDTLEAEASTSAPGAVLALPFFLGEKTPLHDPDLRGVVMGLHLATTRGDLHRGFLEAIAYAFKSHVDVFVEGGLVPQRVRVTNGGSRSRLWREILADVLERDLTSLINHPGASFGAAVLAAIGVGVIDDYSYVDGALDVAEVIRPNPSRVDLYAERYQQYQQLREATTDLSHALARSSQ